MYIVRAIAHAGNDIGECAPDVTTYMNTMGHLIPLSDDQWHENTPVGDAATYKTLQFRLTPPPLRGIC